MLGLVCPMHCVRAALHCAVCACHTHSGPCDLSSPHCAAGCGSLLCTSFLYVPVLFSLTSLSVGPQTLNSLGEDKLREQNTEDIPLTGYGSVQDPPQASVSAAFQRETLA